MLILRIMLIPEKQLAVKKSTLPGAGKGLFTKKTIEKGTRIVEYVGKVTTWKDADHQEGNNPYIFHVKKSHVIDASVDKSALARYANDAKGLARIKGLNNNAEYNIQGVQVYIDAISDIPAGAEILVGYGKDYWDVIRENIKVDKAAAKEKLRLKKEKEKLRRIRLKELAKKIKEKERAAAKKAKLAAKKA